MNKYERGFYFLIIVVVFGLLVYFYTALGKCRDDLSGIDADIGGNKNVSGTDGSLYSFKGTSPGGEQRLIHFNAYSGGLYFIVTYSPHCPHCDTALEKLKETFFEKPPDRDLQVLVLTYEDVSDFELAIPGVSQLKISYDDWVQFGIVTPSIFVVNGRGAVLYKRKGYSPGLFRQLLDRLKASKKQPSEK